MSEGGAGDGGGGYPGGPTPSSTVPDHQDDGKSGLPPFSSFGEMDGAARVPNTDGEALQSSRLLDISSWDYYGEGLTGRLLDRGDGFPMLVPQPQYRPWESKDHPDYVGPPANKLPSFQSQFTAFPQDQNGETVLTTLTPAPASPNSSASGLPSFHTLSTVPPRGYPLVPAPVQAREIPSIQQQILDERHIHLFQGAPHQQYHQLGGYQPQQQTTLLTVVKTEPLIVTQLPTGYEHHEIKMEESQSPRGGYLDSRKKERRKIRASSMESSNESDGVGSSSVESSGQVAAISSTAGFKSPLGPCHQNPNVHSEDDVHEMSDKPVKKKRKRCGECIGCQRKDNCGDCAPCRNDKSHQICKMRRCEKLTEKKHLLYLNHDYPRGERGRGRGKGRGGGSYRKVNQTPRSPLPSPNLQLNGSVDSNMMTNIPDHSAAIRGEAKVEPQVTQSGLPPITASTMPLYSNTVQTNVESSFGTPLREHRFPNSAVWQPATTDPNGTWTPQGQFIQQIPAQQIEEIRYPQYAVAGYPQAAPGYQQNAFMQTNGTVFNNNTTQQTPQPSPHSLHNGTARSTPTLNGNIEYVDQSPRPTEYMNGGSSYQQQQGQDVMAPPTSSTPGSRCSSAALEEQQGKYTNPPTPTTPSNNQGNAMPGYPLQIPPQSAQSLHNSSGYSGQENVAKSGKNGENKHHQQSQQHEEKWKRESLKESRGSSKVRDESQQSAWPGSSKEQENSWQQRHTPHQEIWPPNEPSPTTIHHRPPPNNMDWGKPPTPGGTGAAGSIPPWAVSHQPPSPSVVAAADDPRTRLWNPNGGPPHLMQQHSTTQSHPIHHLQQYSHHQLQSLDVKPERNSPRGGQQQPPPPQQDVWSGAVPPPRPQSNGHSDSWPNDPSGQWPSDKKNQYPERAELNSRLKTMILNKQQQEVKKSDNGQTGYSEQKSPLPHSGNFLAQGHHPQELVSEDGGSWGESPSIKKPAKNPDDSSAPKASEHKAPAVHPSYPPPPERAAPGFIPVSHHPHHYQPPPPPHFMGSHHPGFYHHPHSPYMHGVGLPHPPPHSQALPPPPQSHLPHHNWMHDYRIPPPHSPHHPPPPPHPPKDQFWYPPSTWASATHEVKDQITPQEPVAPPPPPSPIPPSHLPKKVEDKPSEKTERNNEGPRKIDPSPTTEAAQVNTDKSVDSWRYTKGETKTSTSETGTQAFDGKDEPEQPHDNLSEEKDPKKESDSGVESRKPASLSPKEYMDHLEKMKHNARTEIPSCQCFSPDQTPPEPGPYYTHLGYAATLDELRSNSEARTGYKGKAIRMEKILYTGKEGKTTVGCPLAKWIIRRENLDEKLLIVVKNRKGHKCATAWIVVAIVAWEGVPANDADDIYSMLTHKLNKYGLATTRRCATNEPRSCACQGLDPETCGASFSFGCSWSMYYNGCKFARSKDVRKFKLSVRSQEDEVEDKMQLLATQLAPLYEKVAPDSYDNQIEFEKDALECRLGLAPGRPFSGVTACVDFCAHSHRDLHNMNNGCTVVVTLTKHRSLSKPADEQLHVLPLYIMDDSDEHGSKEGQLEKVKSGALENLTKFPCEVRVRAVPLTPCRRHGKKRKDDDEHHIAMPSPQTPSKQHIQDSRGPTPDFLQSSQISSTVVDSSPINSFAGWHHSNHPYRCTTPAQPESPRGQHGILNSPDSGLKWRGDSPLSQHSFCEGELKIDPDSTTSNNQMPPHWNNQKLYASHNMPPNQFRYFPNNPSDGSGHLMPLPPDNQAFRRPKGRPLSRSSNPATPQPTVDSTFLKPRPPSDFKSDRSTSPMMSDLSHNSPSAWNPSPLYPQYSGMYQDIHARSSTYGQSSSHIDAANPFSDGHNPRHGEFEGPSGFRKVERSPSSVPSSPQNPKDDTRHYFNFNHPDDPFIHNPHYQSWGGQSESQSPHPVVKQEFPAASPCSGGSYPRPMIKQEPLDPRDQVKTPHAAPPSQQQPVYGHHPPPPSPHPAQQDSFSPWNCDNTASGLPHESPMMKNWPGPTAQHHSPHPPPHQPMAMKPNVPPGYYGGPEPNKQWTGDYPFQPWHPGQGGPMVPTAPEPPKPEPLGQVTDYIDNEECFKDSQMGGVAIALSHGSVLFECAKHELHASTALNSPNRKLPARISLIFYQHRNLIRPHHGSVEWSEKMRLKEAQKLGAAVKAQQQQQQQPAPPQSPLQQQQQQPPTKTSTPSQTPPLVVKSPTYTTTTWTTLFPMHPCVVTGPYQESETLG